MLLETLGSLFVLFFIAARDWKGLSLNRGQVNQALKLSRLKVLASVLRTLEGLTKQGEYAVVRSNIHTCVCRMYSRGLSLCLELDVC